MAYPPASAADASASATGDKYTYVLLSASQREVIEQHLWAPISDAHKATVLTPDTAAVVDQAIDANGSMHSRRRQVLLLSTKPATKNRAAQEHRHQEEAAECSLPQQLAVCQRLPQKLTAQASANAARAATAQDAAETTAAAEHTALSGESRPPGLSPLAT